MKNLINFSGSTLIATRDEKELQLNIEDLYFIYNDDYFNIMLDESHTNSGLAVFSSMYSDLLVDGEAFTGGADELEALVKSHIGGGGEITIDAALDANSPNAVANSAITTAIDAKASKNEAVGSYQFGATSNVDWINFNKVNFAQSLSTIYYPKINGKGILTTNYNWAKNNYDFQLLETSAIQTTLSSSSTDEQVPSAKAVYDALGDIETLLSQI